MFEFDIEKKNSVKSNIKSTKLSFKNIKDKF